MHILAETDHPRQASAQMIVFSRVARSEVARSVAMPLRTLTTQTSTPTSVYGILFHEEMVLNIVQPFVFFRGYKRSVCQLMIRYDILFPQRACHEKGINILYADFRKETQPPSYSAKIM